MIKTCSPTGPFRIKLDTPDLVPHG
uniref:Uncharacterized protein n=1 Tax=Anguilla anguilla TaxID=7936 RepID=A0A0E9PGF0_ANGAN